MIRGPKLRVWHIPQVPMDPFSVDVSSIEEAIKIINVLADYDLFQFNNNIKPDYCNVSGLEILEDGEWIEWEDENCNTIIDLHLGRVAASKDSEVTE